MGNWTIVIEGVGAHHNTNNRGTRIFQGVDANVQTAEFVKFGSVLEKLDSKLESDLRHRSRSDLFNLSSQKEAARCLAGPQSIMPSPFDACPPSLCRLLARDSRREKALTVAQIAKAAGLSTRTVKRLSNRSSWDGLTIEVVFAFSRACGVNLSSPH